MSKANQLLSLIRFWSRNEVLLYSVLVIWIGGTPYSSFNSYDNNSKFSMLVSLLLPKKIYSSTQLIKDKHMHFIYLKYCDINWITDKCFISKICFRYLADWEDNSDLYFKCRISV